MAYQTVTTTSYGKRVGNSFKNILSGIVLFIAGTVLLWWNEGNFVKTQKMLEEAQGNAIHVESVAKIDSENEGKLIHATANAIATDTLLTDGTFGVSANAIQISRTVEYYQWVENKKTEKKDKVGGGEETITTYTYEKKWVNSPTNSATFEDPSYRNIKNDVIQQFENETKYAEEVTFGAYKLNEGLIHGIGGAKDLEVNTPTEMLAEMDRALVKNLRSNTRNGYNNGYNNNGYNNNGYNNNGYDNGYNNSGYNNNNDNRNMQADNNGQVQATDLQMVHVSKNVIYLGNRMDGNEIGDVRITFKYVPNNQTISLIAKVQGETFGKYVAKNGKSFDRVEMGTKTMEEMFQSANDENSMLTWILRIVGILVVIGGLKMTFEFLSTLLKVLPFLANIMSFGVGLICSIVGFAWSLIIIALAWLFYRPIIGGIILAVVVGLIYYFSTKGKKKGVIDPAMAPAAPVPPVPQQHQGPEMPQ